MENETKLTPERKMEKLTLSDDQDSMFLNVRPEVLKEYLKRQTPELTLLEQLKLVNQIKRELKLGNNQNSDTDSKTIIQNSTLDGSPTLKEPVLHKSGKRLTSETIAAALEVTDMTFEYGYISFADYSARMIDVVGDVIRPYLKVFYELARVSLNVDGMTDAVEVLNFDIDNFAPMKKEESVSKTDTPLRLINHPWALKALWKLAEYLPASLLEMEKDEPMALLHKIEETVSSAMDWQSTVLRNGGNPAEIAITLLDPSYCPEEPEEIEISQSQMDQIYEKLVILSKIR